MSSAEHMHRAAPAPANAEPCPPEQDTNSNLYGMLENALRNQMEVLRSNRLEGAELSPRAAEDDNDDGLDNELSHLEEAERAMRDELAAAVMEFGLSLPKSPTAAAETDVDLIADVPGEGTNDNNNNCSDEIDQKPPSQQLVVPESQHKRQQQQADLSDSTCYNDSTGSPEKISNVSLDDTNAQRSQADMIDERELYAALTDLCQWIREGDSLQLQLQQPRDDKRQTTTSSSTSSPYRRRQPQYSPVRDGGAMRRSVVSPHRYNDATPSDAQRRRSTTSTMRQRRPPNLRELEKNLPVDELCRWLNDGTTPKFANASTMSNGQTERTTGNCSGNQMETETPHTFHVPSVTGTSSLLVLGSNTIRPPQGRSPLRKTHC